MLKFKLLSLLSLGTLLLLNQPPTRALPGQPTEEVAAWIQSNATLRPISGESLLVRKSDTPAHRFEFEASVMPPGRLTSIKGGGLIRSERLSLFDMINGVTPNRLQESLRVIYGLDVYQDFQRADIIYKYPAPPTIERARRERRPLLASIQGELRRGDRFAYWIEIAPKRNNKSVTGRMVVFLKSDLDKIETELRGR